MAGHLLLRQATDDLRGMRGEVRWAVNVGAPCHWQPVVSDGRVYVGLEDGSLVGFATGDPLDTDWPMWGGGCGHNGKPLPEGRPNVDAPVAPVPANRGE